MFNGRMVGHSEVNRCIVCPPSRRHGTTASGAARVQELYFDITSTIADGSDISRQEMTRVGVYSHLQHTHRTWAELFKEAVARNGRRDHSACRYGQTDRKVRFHMSQRKNASSAIIRPLRDVDRGCSIWRKIAHASQGCFG